MVNSAQQPTNQFSNLTEEEFRRAFIAASNGPREYGNQFFNQFKYRYDLFAGNAAAALAQGLDLLNRCHSIDEAAFERIHKGSAYYWLGIAAWLVHDHELATFFFDSSVTEDIRAGHNSYDNPSPSLRFMLLDDTSNNQAAYQLVRANVNRIQEIIKNYNDRLPKDTTPLTIEDIREHFLRKSVVPSKEQLRSSATTFISFCMEWDLRNRLFDIRPKQGTAEPFFMHLFKGCLLFESLLKASPINPPSITDNLEKSLDHFRTELKIDSMKIKLSGKKFPAIIAASRTADTSIQTVIQITGQIRNTLGHNLGWVVEFDKNDYDRLVSIVSSSCLHVIACLYRP